LPIYTSIASGSPRVTAIAAPVNEVGGDGTAGPLLGVLAIEYAVINVEQFSRQFAGAQGVLVTVADQGGQLVAQPDAQPQLDPADRAAIAAARRGRTGFVQATQSHAELIGYAPVRRIGWAVFAEINAADAFADVDRLRVTVLVFAIPLALILLLGAWLLYRTLGYWQRAEAEVRRLAAIDSLTGIYNRRSWDDHLVRELARARRERRPLTVAMIDLDHFKRFNDGHGHPAGDRLLVETAAAWRSIVRATDILARYGGEEFAVALADCSADDAVAIMGRFRAAVPMGQSCSAGLACWNGEESAARGGSGRPGALPGEEPGA
jgi:diguanylate cyclase (GGDEF)-like protein